MRSTHGAAGRGLEVAGGGCPWWMTGGRNRDVSFSLHPRPAVTSNASEKSCEHAPPLSIPREGRETQRQMRASVVQLCQYLYSWWINEPQHTQRGPSSVCDVFMCHIVTEPKTRTDRISAPDLLLKVGTSLSSVHTGTYKVMQYPSNTSIYSHNISECVCQVRSVGRVMKRCVRSCIISCYFHLWVGSSFKDTRRYCSPV